MKLEVCSPVSFFMFWRWQDWKPLPGLLLPLVIPVPPSCGGLTSCDNRFLIAANSQEEDYFVHESL